ncbi:MAG: winged helix-turn-helix transcriptional regulator [Gemmatimonadaceae bacterium]|nr:winged helix-turn-helix transcriptional regulator [Gemmatimonadaceae bacterium]
MSSKTSARLLDFRERRASIADAARRNPAYTIALLARRFKVGTSTVHRALVEHGVPRRRPGRPSTPVAERIRAMAESDPSISHAEIARRVGCSRQRVNQVLGRMRSQRP